MEICGIIAEYNPFHLGHAYQIAETRKRLRCGGAIVCIMSGDFVQRGEAAIFRKHIRAEAALSGGADLVLELPLPWALSSAEGFARGAVGILTDTGVVDCLSFGSECGDINLLTACAETLLHPELDKLIRQNLSHGVSYATARQSAVAQFNSRAADILSRPNDILAVEYLKALNQSGTAIKPMVIRRMGANHDSDMPEKFPSAAWLRQTLANGAEIGQWLPSGVEEVFSTAEPFSPQMLELALLSRLRRLDLTDFAALPDVGEGLEHRLYRAAQTEESLAAIIAAAKTKRYPAARLRRMLCCAALDIRRGDNAGTPPYLRPLAANRRGLEVLAAMRTKAKIPILTKPAAVRKLDFTAMRVFSLGVAAADLWALGTAHRQGGLDWTRGIILADDTEKENGS